MRQAKEAEEVLNQQKYQSQDSYDGRDKGRYDKQGGRGGR